MKKILKNLYILVGLILSINLNSLSMEWTPAPKAEKAKVESESTSELDSILKSSFFKELIKKTKEEKNQLLIETAKSKYFLDSKAQLLKIQLLIKAGADINAKDEFGYTALMWATLNNSIKVVKLLLDEGAKVNIKSKGDYSAFAFVAMSGNDKIGKLLVDKAKKQELYKSLKNGLTPIIDSSDTLEEILSKSLDFIKNTILTDSRFHFSPDLIKVTLDSDKIKKMLNRKFEFIVSKSNDLDEAITEASKIIDIKLEGKIFNNFKAYLFELFESAIYNSKLFEELKDKSLSEKNNELFKTIDRTYLSKAFIVEKIKFLIKASADVNAIDSHGNSVLLHAILCSYPDVKRLFINNQNIEPLALAWHIGGKI